MKILVESLSSAQARAAPAPKAAARAAPAPKAATMKRATSQPAVELAPPQIAKMAGINGLKFSRATHKSLRKGFTVTLQPELRAKANALAHLLVAVKWPKRKPNMELAVSARSVLIVVNNDTGRTVKVGPIVAVSYNAKSKIPRVIHVVMGERKTAVDLYDKASVERLFNAADSKLSTPAKANALKGSNGVAGKPTAAQNAAVKAVVAYKKFLDSNSTKGLGGLGARGFEKIDNLVRKGTLAQWSDASAKLLLRTLDRNIGGGSGSGAVPSVARRFKLCAAMTSALQAALGE